jgi:hypothetical protein
MIREKLVGAGKQYAPTLYTILVNPNDNNKLFGFYPTMGAEIETYLMGKGAERGLRFDGRPLVRFIVDDKLKSGKFDIVAEVVSAPIVEKLRQEEQEYYGLAPKKGAQGPQATAFDDKEYDAASPAFIDGIDVPASPPLHNHLHNHLPNPIPGPTPNPAPEIAGLRAELQRKHRDSGRLRDDVAQARPTDPDSIDSLHAGALVAGIETATAMGTARLVNMSAGKTYPLTLAEMTLGRDPSCEIVVNDANASRRHAQLAQDVVGSWKIADLGSTNGTLLNDRPVDKALLRDGDEITIGMTILQFRKS